MNQENIIKTISFDQQEIIKNIISLHCKEGIELDPTYSQGNFYKNFPELEPEKKFDLLPKSKLIKKSNANSLPLASSSIRSIMFDPPFIVGHSDGSQKGKIAKRFHSFRTIGDLLKWYSECLTEFNRILKPKGVLIFKCQDTISGNRQYFSHVYIMNEAEKLGFYAKDLFVLLAKTRMIGHNQHIQKHARKYHSYFLVFEKR